MLLLSRHPKFKRCGIEHPQTGPGDPKNTKQSRDLAEVRDLLFDVAGCHPVTYADTRLTGSQEVPVERVLTNACLDRDGDGTSGSIP